MFSKLWQERRKVCQKKPFWQLWKAKEIRAVEIMYREKFGNISKPASFCEKTLNPLLNECKVF